MDEANRFITTSTTSMTWCRHEIETFSALVAFCAGNSPVTGEFSAQRPVTCIFDVFFDLGLNQQLSKQWRRRWFETPSRSLWRHCNAMSYCKTAVWTLITHCRYPSLEQSSNYKTMQDLHARNFGRYRFSVCLFTLNIASQSLSAKQIGRNHFYSPLLLLAT